MLPRPVSQSAPGVTVSARFHSQGARAWAAPERQHFTNLATLTSLTSLRCRGHNALLSAQAAATCIFLMPRQCFQCGLRQGDTDVQPFLRHAVKRSATAHMLLHSQQRLLSARAGQRRGRRYVARPRR